MYEKMNFEIYHRAKYLQPVSRPKVSVGSLSTSMSTSPYLHYCRHLHSTLQIWARIVPATKMNKGQLQVSWIFELINNFLFLKETRGVISLLVFLTCKFMIYTHHRDMSFRKTECPFSDRSLQIVHVIVASRRACFPRVPAIFSCPQS